MKSAVGKGSLLILVILVLAYGSISLADEVVTSEYKVGVIGDVKEDLIKQVQKYFDMIPENVREAFQEDEWSVFITTENIGKKYYGANISLLALTIIEDKVIYIDDRKKAVKSVVHEMGHYVDYKNNFVSESKEFNEIYKEELSNFCKVHLTHKNNVSTATEYFAEVYLVAITDPERVQVNCPKSFGFIMSVSENVK